MLLLAFTAESADELDAVKAAAGAERTLAVCLRAPAPELAARLAEREPDRWPGKAGLIAHARELADLAPSLAGLDLAVDTCGRDAQRVAGAVLAAMRQRGLA